MAKAKKKSNNKKISGNTASSAASLWGLSEDLSYMARAKLAKSRVSAPRLLEEGHQLLYLGSAVSKEAMAKFSKDLPEIARKNLTGSTLKPVTFNMADDVVAITPFVPVSSGAFETSKYTVARDAVGRAMATLKKWKLSSLTLTIVGAENAEKIGALVALDLVAYRYRSAHEAKLPEWLPAEITIEGVTEADIEYARKLAFGINLARHFVNLPGAELNPDTYETAVAKFFKGKKNVKISVIKGADLDKENMNLLHGVGRGAEHGPRLIHLRYRPSGSKGKPIALVGKGITFDTGGLNLKPFQGMRLMKKDMGGSAAVLGSFAFLVATENKTPIDAYLAVAENSVDALAYRPGDIIKSRNGKTIEIHNTDAEGRLVLADALDYAVSRKGDEAPRAVFDLATLTGAMKVALGTDIAGFFSNDESLAEKLHSASQKSGDLVWRMPLYSPYKKLLASTFADMTNAAPIPFGGSITAALFLKNFVRDVPWIHLDIFAWNDGMAGAFLEAGGSGQSVALLAAYFDSQRFRGK